MSTWKLFGAIVLAVVATLYFYSAIKPQPDSDIEFNEPLTAREIDGLAATQIDCSWPYELTEKGAWLHRRFDAQKKIDESAQERFNFAMAKYQNLTQDEQCALQEEFSDLLRRWRD